MLRREINYTKEPKRMKRTLISVVIVILVFAVPFSEAFYSHAWGNGGAQRTSHLRNTATKEVSVSYTTFTLNLLPIRERDGDGMGTHDYVLEQAIAQALRGGAELHWLDAVAAQRATSDPDYPTAIRNRFPSHGYYNGFGYGTAPRDIGILYKEVAKAISKKDYVTASKKFGWIAHYVADITSPFHCATGAQTSKVPRNHWHVLHLSLELDLDYYMEYSIGKIPKKWDDDVVEILKYQENLKSLYNKSKAGETISTQTVRAAWFGGTVPKSKPMTKSARKYAIDTAAYARNNYAGPLIKAWIKTDKKKYESNPSPHYIRPSGTKALLKYAPYLLKKSSSVLGAMLVSLSSPKTRSDGYDKIKKPTIKVKEVKLGKKEAKKYRAYKVTYTIKDKKGKAVKELPLQVKRLNSKKKSVASARYWTNSKGQVSYTVKVKASKKKTGKFYFTCNAPTADYDKTVSKAVKIKKLKK
jgi:hypothetical protein